MIFNKLINFKIILIYHSKYKNKYNKENYIKIKIYFFNFI